MVQPMSRLMDRKMAADMRHRVSVDGEASNWELILGTTVINIGTYCIFNKAAVILTTM